MSEVSLAHCRKFTDKVLPYLDSGKACHKIICLEVPGCIQVCTDVFRNTANGCNLIQDLLISRMLTLIDRCIAQVEKCQQIMSVVLLDSPKFSDTSLKALAECKLLKVSIEGNNQITDLSFKLMSKCCPYIRHIHVADCQKITEAGLKMIALKHILVLNMADCTRVSDGCVRPFVQGSSGAKLELSVSSNRDNIIIPVASPTQICVQADADTLEQVWMKPTKTIKGLEHVPCEESSEHCFGKSQEKARDGGDLIAVSKPYQSTQKRRNSQTILKGALIGQAACKQPPKIFILSLLFLNSCCRQAVLKYTAELEKQEHNDADPPSWLGYD
ncbi:LOW QUALITY PROTEIN: F-box and leucine-rich repeat protein 13 [Cyanocitta cristata]